MSRIRLRTRALAACITLSAAALAVGAAGATAGGGASFTNFSLAQTPGTTCPGDTACTNVAAEPQIRANGDGQFFAASENGVGSGTVAFRSLDGGAHYRTLLSPNQGSQANETGLAPGGGDVDVAVAPQKNLAGNYNVYVASLNLANVAVSTSTDNGATWALNPTGATVPGDDREWVAADGFEKVCISYHDVATFNIDVNCSNNAGQTFTQLGDAIDSSHAFQIDNNEIGNLAIDPSSHIVYQTYSAITSPTEATGAGYHGVYMAVSTDGGKTFTDYPVYVDPNASTSYGHQFVNVSVDKAGNVYSVYSDDHTVSYSFSTDHGKTWSGPYRISQGGTAVMPWSVAGDAGKLDVVYYKTPYGDGTTSPETYPSSAAWNVELAQNLDATTPGSRFTLSTPTPVVHYGAVCEGGISCTGNRDLYDDFGVAASPTTGLASIVYSDDQYDPSGPNDSGCTQAKSNTGSCDHTAIATQTSGSGIYATATGGGKKKP